MAKPQSAAVRWTEYVAARLAAGMLGVLSPRATLAAAREVGRGWYGLDHWTEGGGDPPQGPRRMLGRLLRQRRQRTLANLRLAMPHLSDEEHDRLGRCAFEHLVQLAGELFLTPRLIHPGSWGSRIKFDALGPAIELLNAGKPVILVTGHLGNWEVLGYFLAIVGYHVEALARPIDNPLVNDWLLGIRERQGLSIITKWDATDRMLGVLNSGGALAFIADQNAGDKGLFVPFFGRLASTYKSIGLLAISQNVPIVCGYARRSGDDFRFELAMTDIIRPADWARREDPLYYVTARYVRAIETMVRECPEQYLWMHRRWRSRPRHERLGKSPPTSLRRSLESLDWLAPEEVDRALEPLPQP